MSTAPPPVGGGREGVFDIVLRMKYCYTDIYLHLLGESAMAKKIGNEYSDNKLYEDEECIEIGSSPIPGITLRKILSGHTASINQLKWSPNGRYLASSSNDKSIRIWDLTNGKCVSVLEGHKLAVRSIAWSPDGDKIISGSDDANIYVWDVKTKKIIREIMDHTHAVLNVAWSLDGKRIASSSFDKTVRIWNSSFKRLSTFRLDGGFATTLLLSPDNKVLMAGISDGALIAWGLGSELMLFRAQKHIDKVVCLAWKPDTFSLASGSDDLTIKLWDTKTGYQSHSLEGHTKRIKSLSFSADGNLLISKSDDETIRLWHTKRWETIAILQESTSTESNANVLFHPNNECLVTFAKNDTEIRVWNIDYESLISNIPTTNESIRYMTAKIVLVGESGVGKTGLGWRLAHNAFKEHPSTHGQQFWVVPELGIKRKDGTECEAVLWDLAGQHVFRSVHSIFLDNVDVSLLLFDASDSQEPLKGVEFWLNQLAGKNELPPSILVGARSDVSPTRLSQSDLDYFCKKHSISGGYISTSAKTGEGVNKLIKVLKEQIPWAGMTATVTTVTFKRIKEYVLSLKEKTSRKGVLVHPTKLRQQLQAIDKDWKFSDAEMMAAVRHLANLGYVTILQSSSGIKHILLTPDLLVDLASSIFILADKQAKELGAINEAQLLQGKYNFDEVAGLDAEERRILLDSAIVRFLEHSICFRETLGNRTLLIFPSLIKQKRPLQENFDFIDDVSYVLRGRVENIYASLVVLLGYTSTFTRVNQWQNQAQYEMGNDGICGFRLIEEREGEMELVLYYSTTMPMYGRNIFQGLFENFLNKQDIDIKCFPPVLCSEKHLQDRATIMRMLRDGAKTMFCAKCGVKISLGELYEPVEIGARVLAQVDEEEAVARLRNKYEVFLARVKSFRSDRRTPRCYVSYAEEQSSWSMLLIRDLQDAGVVVLDPTEIHRDDFIIIIGTPDYVDAMENSGTQVAKDIQLINSRISKNAKQKTMIAPLLLEGNIFTAFSREIRNFMPGDFRVSSRYVINLFDLILTLYAIPFDQRAFEPLRDVLRKQWEESLNKKNELPSSGVFISYAWGGESEDTVNELDKIFTEKGITIIRDKRELGYKGRIRAFMQNIGVGKAIIVVISEKYLKSDNCMFELLEIERNGNSQGRIFPIVLNNAKIYAPAGRLRYVKYWEQKIARLEKEIRSVSAANLQGINDDINLYIEIRAKLPHLANILKDMNTLSKEVHHETGYQELFNQVVKKLQESKVPKAF
jgi:small GTP-binding protein